MDTFHGTNRERVKALADAEQRLNERRGTWTSYTIAARQSKDQAGRPFTEFVAVVTEHATWAAAAVAQDDAAHNESQLQSIGNGRDEITY